MTYDQEKRWLQSFGGTFTGPSPKADEYDEIVVSARGAERRSLVPKRLTGKDRQDSVEAGFIKACTELRHLLERA